ncbi:beta-1,6-N-acetylglucosaminyltransferase [Flavobacterium sp. W20_MBD1_R3]|uniref:beta-1,6-N-acetylglucosaminyltransferase n=1 Tax=Flavobacterium sp. W20_MBD1_R3 TaxID=3240278 RepID=UPI003F90C82F
MKQAILITAYKDFNHLEEIIKFFDENFELYIHIDKKSNVSAIQLSRFQSYLQVKLISQKYKVNWGGINHLKSILYLSEQALKNPLNSYFHLISGQDYPIKKASYFRSFFDNKKEEHIEFFSIPNSGLNGNGGLERIEYFNFYDILNAKISYQNRLIKSIINLQKKLNFKRSISLKMPKIYGGSTWWSLSRDCLSYVVEFTKLNAFVLRRFNHTLCSEEFYFQTVIMNSIFSKKVVGNNLRYIDWHARNGSEPAFLDNSDYEKLIKSDAFFARKIGNTHSIGLMNKIKTFTLNK